MPPTVTNSAETLWRPTPETLARSHLTHFCRSLELPFYGPAKLDGSIPDHKSFDFPVLHQWSIEHRDEFWQGVWQHCGVIGDTGGSQVLSNAEQMFESKFFPDATLNFAENLLENSQPEDQTALIGRTENGSRRSLSWAELRTSTNRLANRLKALGIAPGDRVAAALPNGIDAAISMLATTKLGAIWSSCSPDFGVDAMTDRFEQIAPKIVLGCSTYSYAGKHFECIDKLNALMERLAATTVLMVDPLSFQHEPTQDEEQPYVQLPFAAPVFIMFSSGTTGAPKCIVHSIGGTLLKQRSEHALHCDLGPDDRLLFFTTCGWMMWNWLLGAMAGGTTIVLYDGSPFHPDPHALLDIAQEEQLTHIGISPGFLSTLSKQDTNLKVSHPNLVLKSIFATGSVLPDASFHWVAEQFGTDVQLASISGGTDILGCFALGNPWQPVVAGEIQGPALGIALAFVDDAGSPKIGEKGELVCTRSFPSQPVGFWNDTDNVNYRAAYFERFDNVWHHGDYGEINAHGGVRIHGRSDAVLNRGGVRIGTAEIYRQLEPLQEVTEAIVVAQRYHDDSRIILFVRLQLDIVLDDDLIKQIRKLIRTGTSPRHLPDLILQVADIPRTRSGKIVELAITSVINGEPVKNTGSLANPEALAEFGAFAELELEAD